MAKGVRKEEKSKSSVSTISSMCEYDEENEYCCLECKLPHCVHDIEDRWRAVLAKQKQEEERKRRSEEDKKVMEELLEMKWMQYKKYHPNGMGELQYKTRQRSNLKYQINYRKRKLDSG